MFHVGLLFEWKQYYHFLWIAANPKSVCFRLFVVILDAVNYTAGEIIYLPQLLHFSVCNLEQQMWAVGCFYR
jgi:hypothetical protein